MRLIIFSDLDGTLLDHDGYGFEAARPTLDRLARACVPVVLASSKTAAEVALWRDRMGLTRWPAIVENGAALYEGAFDDAAYRRLRAILATLGAPFAGFGDMDAAEVAALTGLSEDEARLAKRRGFSEPGVWRGQPEALAGFLRALAGQGVTARRGGRFLTLSFGGSKADRMAELRARFAPDAVIALGDAPNDAEMLTAADIGVVVRNDRGAGLPTLPGETGSDAAGPGGIGARILRTRAEGPAGWAEGVARALDLLGRPLGDDGDACPEDSIEEENGTTRKAKTDG